MSIPNSWIPSTDALVVLGSLNAKVEDRHMQRSALRPVQMILDHKIIAVPSFDSWGEFGVSSMAWQTDNPFVLFVSTGSDLIKLDLKSKQNSPLNVPNLKDVHEMTVIENILWLANTGYDECIAFDIQKECVVNRTSLAPYRSKRDTDDHKKESKGSENGNLVMIDKFHCNQIFEGFDNDLYCLVHHISGIQKIRKLRTKVIKMIKSQGDGGVINLSTEKPVFLGLMAPHHVRKVQRNYWLFDSCNNTINVYSPSWKLKKKISTKGFGRGADISEELGLFYAGISETRKRYLRVVQGAKQTPNMIQIFSLKKGKLKGEIVLSNIEQVNNNYLISREVALPMLDL